MKEEMLFAIDEQIGSRPVYQVDNFILLPTPVFLNLLTSRRFLFSF